MYSKVFEYQIKFKKGTDKNTEYRKTKSLFVKRIDIKCRLLQLDTLQCCIVSFLY